MSRTNSPPPYQGGGWEWVIRKELQPPTSSPLHKGEECLISLLPQIEAHASSTNAEVCGFVYKDRYIPIPNKADRPEQYFGDPQTLARVLNQYGEPEIIFHTHPDGNLKLSQKDRRLWYYVNSTMMVGCMSGGHLRWKIYGDRKD